MTSKELIQEIAGKLEVTPEQLAADIHALCSWIQGQGNRGYTELQLKDAGLPVYFLGVDKALWDGMLFHAEGQGRKDYSGWGVKRHPMIQGEVYAWEVSWLNTFQYLETKLTSQIRAKIEAVRTPSIKVEDWVEYQGESWWVSRITSSSYYLEDLSGNAAFAKRDELTKLEAPRRKRAEFAGGSFSSYSTFEIAYRAACCYVMCHWYRGAYHRHMHEKRNYPYREAAVIWQQEYAVLLDELRFRSHVQPPLESSKKKAEATAEDWAKAKAYAENPVPHFFSQEFVLAAIESSEYPDLSIDPEHLPKAPSEKTPVAWKSDREILADVLKWLDKDIDPTSFEYEDRKTFVEMARRWLATAKGEKAHE